jgi:hypothetical protein
MAHTIQELPVVGGDLLVVLVVAVLMMVLAAVLVILVLHKEEIRVDLKMYYGMVVAVVPEVLELLDRQEKVEMDILIVF